MTDRIRTPFQRVQTTTDRLTGWWGWLTDPWSSQSNETEILRRLHNLEIRMSAVDDMVARFAAATDEIASDLDALRAEVANLDAGVAAKFEPLVTRLESLGADPSDPVPPAPEPAPQPVPEPAPEPPVA